MRVFGALLTEKFFLRFRGSGIFHFIHRKKEKCKTSDGFSLLPIMVSVVWIPSGLDFPLFANYTIPFHHSTTTIPPYYHHTITNMSYYHHTFAILQPYYTMVHWYNANPTIHQHQIILMQHQKMYKDIPVEHQKGKSFWCKVYFTKRQNIQNHQLGFSCANYTCIQLCLSHI